MKKKDSNIQWMSPFPEADPVFVHHSNFYSAAVKKSY